MNLKDEVIYKIAKREIQRILLVESTSPILLENRYTLEEVVLAELCQEGVITYEEFVKQRIVYENGISHQSRRL